MLTSELHVERVVRMSGADVQTERDRPHLSLGFRSKYGMVPELRESPDRPTIIDRSNGALQPSDYTRRIAFVKPLRRQDIFLGD